MKLLTFSAGRRAKWLVLVAWLIVLAAAGPFAGELLGAASNDRVHYLPKSAESTEVIRLQESFPQGKSIPAMVVYSRDGGLTAADRQRADADMRRLTAEYAPNTRPGQPIVSKDGEALFYQVPLAPTGDEQEGEVILDAVDGMRETLGGGGGGLEIMVTGPAGLGADEFLIFRDMEFTLVLIPVVVVAVLLLLIYRSPILFLVPLFSVAVANQFASAVLYGLIEAGMTVNSMAASVMSILIYGAGTDYALLLIARYREELGRHTDRHEAMRVALRRSGPAIIASGGTVGLGLLCLVVADLNSTRILAPIGLLAVTAAVAAMLTLLPALLVICGRWLFWPRVPAYGEEQRTESGLWNRVGRLVAARPRALWLGTAAFLAVCALGLTAFNVPQRTDFRTPPESVQGQDLIAAHFAAGTGNPVDVITNAGAAAQVTSAARQAGAQEVRELGRADGRVQLQVVFAAEPRSAEEREAVEELRDRLHAVPGAEAKVGGPTAIELDMLDTNQRDSLLAIPLVLLVIMLILFVLLRALTLSVLLIATVVLSFAAALGLSVFVFENAFHWYGQDPQLPLLAFVFLVALGVDYNIFLMSRVREETRLHGVRTGTVNGLVTTGGVITSAGLVLAATFSVLVSLPVVGFAEQGFIVAVGVLLDTLIVRSLLVPALTLDLGRRVWWPSGLAAGETGRAAREPVMAGERGD